MELSGLKNLFHVLDDWRMKASAVLLLLMIIVFTFNLVTGIPLRKPLIGVFSYGMVPALFIVGAINFLFIIIKSRD
jgi:hypothetical protein